MKGIGTKRKPPVNSPAEVERLVADNQRLALHVLARLCRIHPAVARLDWDEARQAALLGLWRAAQLWESSRSQFSTYAWYAVRSAVLAEACAESRGRRRNGSVSLETLAAQDGELVSLDRIRILAVPANDLDPDDRRELVERGLARLRSEPRRLLLLRYQHGLTLQQVADLLGVSKERARQRVAAALAALRKEVRP